MTKKVEPKPVLIIVPGIGDATPVYYSFARRWAKLGYDAQVISFGWNQTTADLPSKLDAFARQLSRFNTSELYLIGISAGGTAVINMLAEDPRIKRVIAVCTPLDTMQGLRNPLLAESIARAKRHLTIMSDEQKQRILSTYGFYDQVVHVTLSNIRGIPTKRIFGLIHAPTIYIAMQLYARQLSRFLQGGSPD